MKEGLINDKICECKFLIGMLTKKDSESEALKEFL